MILFSLKIILETKSIITILCKQNTETVSAKMFAKKNSLVSCCKPLQEKQKYHITFTAVMAAWVSLSV